MKNYKDLLRKVIHEGIPMPSRAGDVLRLSHEMLSWDLRDGFPAITSRKLHTQAMLGELACFVKGLTNIQEFKIRGCNIWDANLADYNAKNNCPDNTDLGRIYGALWRDLGSVDQLRSVIDGFKKDPYNRRLVVSAWYPADFDKAVLPPCHYSFQISAPDNEHIDLIFNMRSCDLALGAPFDIASYAVLLHLIANEVKRIPRKLTAVFADAHIYVANLEGVQKYVNRPHHELPMLGLNMPRGASVETFEPHLACLIGYISESHIPMEMAI